MSVGLFDELFRSLIPTQKMSTADWFRENFYADNGSPFSEYMVPWVTAPNGPCDAADNPRYRRIWLQWAARMFKTTFAQGLQLKYAHLDPCRMMFASADESNVKSVFGRLWQMIEHTPALRDQLPTASKRAATNIKLGRCVIHGAWPLGKSKLADKAIRVGHANEIDKWVQQSTSTEGDPLPRFLKRHDDTPDSIAVLESTPAERTTSRIEHGRLNSTNCSYWVPCPHCYLFQVLRLGDGQKPGGIFWEKDASGRSDPDLARDTAYYVCQHCEQHIDDTPRPWMVRHGVWVHEGCQVDHELAMQARELPQGDRSWMTGEPLRDGEDYGSRINSLYGLFQGWGQIAAKYVRAKRKPALLKAFVTEEKAETWEVVQREAKWEGVGQRIIRNDIPERVVPRGYNLITAAIDKQKEHYVYSIMAWARGQRSHTLAYGTIAGGGDRKNTAGHEELVELLSQKFTLEKSDLQLPIRMALIDSGHYPQNVGRLIQKCIRTGIRLMPCKGSSVKLEGAFKQSLQGKGTQLPGHVLVLIDPYETQTWAEEIVSELEPGDFAGSSVFAGSLAKHENFLQQLMNDGPVDRLDSRNRLTITWDRIDAGLPNDYRDVTRYNLVAYLLAGGDEAIPKTVELEMTSERKGEKATSESFVRQTRSSFIRRRS